MFISIVVSSTAYHLSLHHLVKKYLLKRAEDTKRNIPTKHNNAAYPHHVDDATHGGSCADTKLVDDMVKLTGGSRTNYGTVPLLENNGLSSETVKDDLIFHKQDVRSEVKDKHSPSSLGKKQPNTCNA